LAVRHRLTGYRGELLVVAESFNQLNLSLAGTDHTQSILQEVHTRLLIGLGAAHGNGVGTVRAALEHRHRGTVCGVRQLVDEAVAGGGVGKDLRLIFGKNLVLVERL
jgi:hypothetical protein